MGGPAQYEAGPYDPRAGTQIRGSERSREEVGRTSIDTPGCRSHRRELLQEAEETTPQEPTGTRSRLVHLLRHQGHGKNAPTKVRRSECPAFGTRCNHCDRDHHYERVCRVKHSRKQPGTEQENAVFDTVCDITSTINIEVDTLDHHVYSKITRSWSKRQSKATPTVHHSPIPVPIHWQDEVKAGLDRDVRLGVIEPVPVGEPVTWCHHMVICAKKNGSLRHTIDFQPLNAHATRETHHTQSPFHQARSVPQGMRKMVFDAWNGYHSVALHQEDRHYTTFITPWGRYRTTRIHCLWRWVHQKIRRSSVILPKQDEMYR